MPFIRCRCYTDKGDPIGGGCTRQNAGCEYVHPSEPAWDRAPPSRKNFNRGGGFGRIPPSDQGWKRDAAASSSGARPARSSTPSAPSAAKGRGWGGGSKATGLDLSAAWLKPGSSTDQSEPPTSISAGWSGDGNVGGGNGWGNPSGWGSNTSSKKEPSGEYISTSKGKARAKPSSGWGSAGGWAEDTVTWGISGDLNSGHQDTPKGWKASMGSGGWGFKGTADTTEANIGQQPDPSDDASRKDSSGWSIASTSTASTPSWAPISSGTNAKHLEVKKDDTYRGGKWKAVATSMPPPPAPAGPQLRPSVNTKFNEATRNGSMSPSTASVPMDVDSVGLSTSPVVTSPIRPVIIHDSHVTSTNTVVRPTASQVVQSGRPENAVPPENNKTRKLVKDLSRAQARQEWNKYLKLLLDSLLLRQENERAEGALKQYRVAQRSNHHTRVGQNGMTILDGTYHRLSTVATESKQMYEKKLTELIQFEESYDFPIQSLGKEQLGSNEVPADSLAIKRHMQDVKTWMSTLQKALGELDQRSISVLGPRSTTPMTTQTTSVAAAPTTANAVQILSSASSRKAKPLKRSDMLKVTAKLDKLVEDVEQLSQVVEDSRSKERIQDLVSEKLDDFAYLAQEDADSQMDDGEEEDTPVMSQVNVCREAVALIGSDVEELGTECAALIRKVSDLEENVNALVGASPIEKARTELRTMKQEYQALREQNDQTSAMLEEQKAQLTELRVLAASLQGASDNITTFPTHQEILEAILPSIREQLRNDVTAVGEETEKMVHAYIEEEHRRIIGDLWATIEPVLQTARLERKTLTQRPRAASPHTSSGDAKLGAYTHSNHT